MMAKWQTPQGPLGPKKGGKACQVCLLIPVHLLWAAVTHRRVGFVHRGWPALLVLMFLWLLTDKCYRNCAALFQKRVSGRPDLNDILLLWRLSFLNKTMDTQDLLPPGFPRTSHEFGRISVPLRVEQGAEHLPECSLCPPSQSVSHQQMLRAKGQAPGGLSCSSSMAVSRTMPG